MTVQELYANIGGDYASAKKILMMDKMISRFIVKLLDDKSCSRLLTAGQTMDPVGLFEGAHAMKGVCANLGLENLSRAAGELTEEFRPGSARTMDDAAVTDKLAALKADYDKTIAGIRAFAEQQ